MQGLADIIVRILGMEKYRFWKGNLLWEVAIYKAFCVDVAHGWMITREGFLV